MGLVPARGGSKGVPRKNVRPAGGKPLIAWTIEAAKAASTIDAVVLSSDDPEIIETARHYGCDVPFIRPAELAGDEADSLSVVRHAIAAVGRDYDLTVLLQPTSPLRTAGDIDGAVRLFAERPVDSCVSVCAVDKSPWWMYRRRSDGTLAPIMEGPAPDRRQAAPAVYALNGAVYVARSAHLAAGGGFITPQTVGYVMPSERSLDIDVEFDFKLLELMLSEAQV